MAETFSDVMNAAMDAGGDTGTPIPAAPAANASPGPAAGSGSAAAPETTTPQPETPAAVPDAAPEGEQPFKWDNVPPELMPLAKQFQGDYTRKMQELAEQRKAYEGVDPGAVQWLTQVRGLAQTNPEIAAQLLQAEAAKLGGQPDQQPDPYAEKPWATDTERFLAEEVRGLKQLVQQQEMARSRAEIDRTFEKLEKDVGRNIPYEERVKVAQFCVQNGIQNPEIGWKALNWGAAVQQGRNEAAQIVQQKSTMGAAPNGAAGREAPPTTDPKSVREALELAFSGAE